MIWGAITRMRRHCNISAVCVRVVQQSNFLAKYMANENRINMYTAFIVRDFI